MKLIKTLCVLGLALFLAQQAGAIPLVNISGKITTPSGVEKFNNNSIIEDVADFFEEDPADLELVLDGDEVWVVNVETGEFLEFIMTIPDDVAILQNNKDALAGFIEFDLGSISADGFATGSETRDGKLKGKFSASRSDDSSTPLVDESVIISGRFSTGGEVELPD